MKRKERDATRREQGRRTTLLKKGERRNGEKRRCRWKKAEVGLVSFKEKRNTGVWWTTRVGQDEKGKGHDTRTVWELVAHTSRPRQIAKKKCLSRRHSRKRSRPAKRVKTRSDREEQHGGARTSSRDLEEDEQCGGGAPQTRGSAAQ